MTLPTKNTCRIFVMFLCVQFLNVFSIANAQAETTIDDIRKKGQQCIAWQKSSENLDRTALHGCLNSCARLGEMAISKPDLLTDERINTCHEVYSALERQVAGKPPVPEEAEAQPPATIEAMATDMKEKEQECKAKVESANTDEEKRNAEVCYNTCYRNIIKNSRNEMPLEQAQINWKMCVDAKV